MAADRDEDDAGLLERLTAAKKLLQRAAAEGEMEAGIAAAACAELAGEYAAMFAAERGLPAGPVLDEVARVMRRRGAAVHHCAGARRAGREQAGAATGRRGLRGRRGRAKPRAAIPTDKPRNGGRPQPWGDWWMASHRAFLTTLFVTACGNDLPIIF